MARRRSKSSARFDLRQRQQAGVEEVELQQPTVVASPLHRWGPIAFIAVVTAAAYWPSYDNEFVAWDDDHYVFDNHQVHYNDGILSIWGDVLNHSDPKFQREKNDTRVSHQYYPLLFTTYWLEFRFHQWFGGADPDKTVIANVKDGKMTATSFHVVNTVLHIVNCMLLIMCFRALGVSNWVAWAATIIFAVHPMQVATVAWITERKNIMALMFYLLSLTCYVRMRRSGNWWWYALSLVMFQSALFSKTVAVTLPAMLFFTDRLLEKRWLVEKVYMSALRVIPFLMLSGVAAWITTSVEDRNRTIPIDEQQRPLVAGATVTFYPAKMLAPTDLSPIYPQWEPNAREFQWYIPLITAMTLGVLIVIFRRKLGRHFIWAILFYVITQFPMMGFKDINYFQFAFVADHYFYNGAPGLCLALALGLDALRRRLGEKDLGAAVASGLVLVATAAYAVQTFRYSETWKDSETFWLRTLAMNPNCWPAWYNRANARVREADVLKSKGQVEEADKRFKEASEFYWNVARIHPKIRQPFDALIKLHESQRNVEQTYEAAKAGAERFTFLPEFHLTAAQTAEALGKNAEAVKHLDNVITILEQRKPRSAVERKAIIEKIVAAHWQAARIATRIKDYAEVEKHYTEAAPLFIQSGNELRGAEAYIFAADAAEELNQLERAKELYRKGKAIKLKLGRQFQASGQPASAAPAFADAALAAKKLGEIVEAKDMFVTAGDLYLQAGDRLFNAGEYGNAHHRYRIAHSVFREAAGIDPGDASIGPKISTATQKMQQANAKQRAGQSRSEDDNNEADGSSEADSSNEDDGE